MVDINLIRKNPKQIKKAIKAKGANVDIDKLLELDKKRREIIQEKQKIEAKQNKISQSIPCLKNKEKKDSIKKARDLSLKIDQKQEDLDKIEKDFYNLLKRVPNPALGDVKIGKDESENEVIEKHGQKPDFDFKPKDHIELGESLNIIDIKRAAKVSGTGFGYLKNEAAILEFALVSYGFEFLSQYGFSPIVSPAMIKKDSMASMGYLERGEDEIYQTKRDNLFLTGTAEQSIGPMHKKEILDKKDLPMRYAGFSSCFRREAGSYGKDVKGILRVHQFDKMEMFVFALPENARKEHQKLLQIEKELVTALKLPFRVIKICTGDLGDSAAFKYDIECFLPSQDRYLETHSTSNCTDYQARRLNVKYRDKSGNLSYVYTLNGTLFAVGRILIAILENYQQKDGSIKVPEVLQKYVNFNIIEKK